MKLLERTHTACDRLLASRMRSSCLAIAVLSCGAMAACTKTASPPIQSEVTSSSKTAAPVAIPKLKLGPGDVIDPLPENAPLPSTDPRNFEGTWVGLGRPITEDGKPPPYVATVQADMQRRMELDKQGAPVVNKKSLCRPPGIVSVAGNQFPTQIIQRPDKILFIAEENRGVWAVYMNQQHPKNLKPLYVGHNVGHWEGNTLVIDSTGFLPRTAVVGDGTFSGAIHVTTRMTRANTGDKLNGDRIVISRTIEDPNTYDHPWTQLSVARWRPDLEMLEFNCEESTPALTADGLAVE